MEMSGVESCALLSHWFKHYSWRFQLHLLHSKQLSVTAVLVCLSSCVGVCLLVYVHTFETVRVNNYMFGSVF